MKRAWLMIGVVGLTFFVGTVAPAAGAKKPTYARSTSNTAAQRAKNAANQARHNLSDAQRQLSEARRQAAAADNRADRQSYETEKIRESVRKEHDTSPGMQTVRRIADESRREYEQLRQPVLEKLANTRPYQDAVAARNRIGEQLKTLPSSPSDQRRKLEHEYMTANARVHQLEREACEAEPAVRKAKELLDIDERDLREQIGRRDLEIARDSRLTAAQSEVSQARAASDAANQKVAQEARQLVGAQQNYVQKTVAAKRTQARNSPNKRRR